MRLRVTHSLSTMFFLVVLLFAQNEVHVNTIFTSALLVLIARTRSVTVCVRSNASANIQIITAVAFSSVLESEIIPRTAPNLVAMLSTFLDSQVVVDQDLRGKCAA